MELILASQSPRRRELFSLVGLDYTAITSDADENIPFTEARGFCRAACPSQGGRRKEG